jgi:SNF2 family DNA or RNA helicase
VPLQIFDYQKTGANFLARRQRAGLFDQMRVGKSAQAVRAADLLMLKRIIVICPAAVREVWRGEFAKFGIMRARSSRASTSTTSCLGCAAPSTCW